MPSRHVFLGCFVVALVFAPGCTRGEAACAERCRVGERCVAGRCSLSADAGGVDSPPTDGASRPDVPRSGELCGNGVDDDGNGMIDEGCDACVPGEMRACYGHDPAAAGVGACARGRQTCGGEGEFGMWLDCEGDVAPAAMDVCDNGIDDDCDGAADEACACAAGSTRACYPFAPTSRGVGLCADGTQRCDGSGWGACTGAVGPQPELCNGGSDDDCDGRVDEGCATMCPRPPPTDPSRGRALIIGEGEAACPFVCMLALDGWRVDHLPADSDLTGAVALDVYEVVLLLDGTEWVISMPDDGQRALSDYVRAGGGLVVLEWVVWEIGVTRRYTGIADILPVDYGGSWTTAATTYTLATAHPVTDTFPSSFAVPHHGYSLGTLRPGGVALATHVGTTALAVSEPGTGRVVWFGGANGWADFCWLDSRELTSLVVRSVDWTARQPDLGARFSAEAAAGTCACP